MVALARKWKASVDFVVVSSVIPGAFRPIKRQADAQAILAKVLEMTDESDVSGGTMAAVASGGEPSGGTGTQDGMALLDVGAMGDEGSVGAKGRNTAQHAHPAVAQYDQASGRLVRELSTVVLHMTAKASAVELRLSRFSPVAIGACPIGRDYYMRMAIDGEADMRPVINDLAQINVFHQKALEAYQNGDVTKQEIVCVCVCVCVCVSSHAVSF